MMTLLPVVLALTLTGPGAGETRITGSSTAAPIIAEAVELAGADDISVVPTGTVRGFQELCREMTVAAIGASRPVTDAELAECAAHGIDRLVEIPIALDGIVLAEHAGRSRLGVDLRELYLAAALQVPVDEERCVLVPNPNRTWSDINRALPNRPIKFYGPPASSGTRAMFIDLALVEGARQIACLEELERQDPEAFERAVIPRHDEIWLDAGENDQAVAAALLYAREAIGIIGWSSFANAEGLRAVPLGGVFPSLEAIRRGVYPLSRPLYVYVTPGALSEPSVRRLVSTLSDRNGSGEAKVYTTGNAAGSDAGLTTTVDGKRVYRTP